MIELSMIENISVISFINLTVSIANQDVIFAHVGPVCLMRPAQEDYATDIV